MGKVKVMGGASCHVGYRSCFYRKIEYSDGKAGLLFTKTDKVFDPEEIYGEEPNQQSYKMSIVDTISYELWDKDPEAFTRSTGKKS